MPPSTNESEIAGPAFSAAACPVSTKKPAPITAPMPSMTRLVAVSVRFRPCSWLSAASALRPAMDLRTHRLAIGRCLSFGSGSAIRKRRAVGKRGPASLLLAKGDPGRRPREADGWTGRLYHTGVFQGNSKTSILRISTRLPGSCCWKAKYPSFQVSLWSRNS